MKLSRLLFTVVSCLTALLSSPIGISSAIAASPGDAFGLSPFWDLRTIDTQNFRISFPADLEPQAVKAAQYFEEAHHFLTADLLWNPQKKVNVLLIDNADAANGMATPVLRFGMLLYMTPPDNWFSTTFYDDWLKLLIFHEYAHFVNMDPTRGAYSYLRVLFGDVFLPNSLWSTWMLEGLATYMETKYTPKGGRGRSTYFDMVLRAAIEADKLNSSEWIRLNRLISTYPWHPSGETPYIFGYYLMNEVARDKPENLGELSIRSSARVPFFINGNLENVTGKDWYAHWQSFVDRARTKAHADLDRIRQSEVTSYNVIDDTHFETLGSSVSRDGRLLAYNHESEHHWQTLRLKDIPSGKTRIVEDKFSGVSLSFTPDSRALVYSSLRRLRNYYLLSDLKAYEVEKKKSYWLTHGQRARDPHVSADGSQIVYTVTEKTGVHLHIADLRRNGGRLILRNSRRLVEVEPLDRISTPKFSPDGKTIVYSLKINGESGEKLMRVGIMTGTVETLVSDDHYHRFPAYAPDGTLYFISNRTGVDNLHRFDEGGTGVQVTNLTGGMALPTFAGDQVYGSMYSWRGWSLASLPRAALSKELDSAALTISPPDAPAPVDTSAGADTTAYVSKRYSAWNSLAPRQWAPFLLLDDGGGYLGGQIAGYDQALEHTYLLAGIYNLNVKNLDHAVAYQNRNLGVNINVYSTQLTSSVLRDPLNADRTTYRRDRSAGLSLSFPFQFITSVLEPEIGASIKRDNFMERVGDTKKTLRRSRYVPTQSASIRYRRSRSSRLAVAPEEGRVTFAGVRRYDDSEIENYKFLARHSEFIHLGKHYVLVPSVRGMKVSRENPRFLDANAVLSGDREQFLNVLPGDSFDQLGLRGYPRLLAAERELYIGSLDLRFPLAHIFRAWGTNPFVLNQLYANVFAENAYIPAFSSSFRNLYSAGAGLRLTTQMLNVVPLTLGLEYHHGLNSRARGEGDVIFTLNMNALPFEF